VKTAYVLSWIIAVLAVVASVAGLAVPGMYRDEVWKGLGPAGDIVTLALGAPVLAAATVLAARGSARGRLVWIGALCYMLYAYGFYLFGAPVNKLFMAYAALFTLSGLAVAFSLARGGAEGVGAGFRARTPVRWIAGYMFALAALVVGVWFAPWARFVLSGEIPRVNGSADAYRFIAAMDLAFLVTPMFLGAQWLWRRKALGFALAAAANVQWALYSVLLSVSCLVSWRAGAPGALDNLPLWVGLGAGSCLCVAGLLANVEGGGRIESARPGKSLTAAG
jgi:hypothetical protein